MAAPTLEVRTAQGRADLFHRVPQFAYFTTEEKDLLAELAQVKQYAAGVDVYIEGKAADSFSVIAYGTLIKRNANNRRPLGPLTVIGTLPLLRRNERLRRRTAGLVTETDSILVEIPYAALDRLSRDRKDAFVDNIAEEALVLIERLDHGIQA
jgi:CRP-like cAMP-binding protein